MSDTRELLRPGVEGFEPTSDAFERVLARRDRKRRNQRFAAVVLAIAVFAIAAIGFLRLLGSEPTPARPEPSEPRNGRFVVFSALHLDPDPDAPLASRGERFDLFVAGPDANARLLVADRNATTTRGCPVFSPDGSLLAYGEWTMAPTGGAIVVARFMPSGDLQGPEIRIPVPTVFDFSPPCPTWAPVGERLAVFMPRQGVMFADADGTTRMVRIDDFRGLDEISALEWSPDGSRVAALPSPYAVSKTLWIVPADGGAPRSLTEFETDADPWTISWTADGRAVVVGGSVDRAGPNPRPFVRVVDLATGSTSEVPLPASWDGSGLLQMLAAGGDRFIVIRDLTGSPPAFLDLQGHATPLGDLEFQHTSFISLSPDGTKMLYVTYDPSLGQTLVAVPLDGGEPTRYSP